MDSAASELNLGALIPSISTVMGWIVFAFRIAVLAGPLILLGFGLKYLRSPAKEANHSVGYRFRRSMASPEAWAYTQRIAGLVWSRLGGALTVVLLIVCAFFGSMDPMTMAWTAVICILIELVLIVAACIAINTAVMKKFDKNGLPLKETEK